MSNSEWFEFELIYHLRPNKGKRVWGSWGEEGDEETSHWKVTRKITINLFFSKMMFSKFCYTDLHWWWELLRVLLFLEWARKHACVFSPTQLCPTLCNPINCSPPQAPLSMGFSRQEYWSGLPFPPPGDLLNPGIEPASLASLALADRFFTTSTTWEAKSHCPLLISSQVTLASSPLSGLQVCKGQVHW